MRGLPQLFQIFRQYRGEFLAGIDEAHRDGSFDDARRRGGAAREVQTTSGAVGHATTGGSS